MTTSIRGEKLVALREVCGLTQAELAELVGRSVHTIRGIEQGKNVLGERLAAVISAQTGTRIHWLLDDEATGPPINRLGNVLTRERYEAHAFALAKGEGALELLRRPSFGDIMGSALRDILHRAESLPGFDLAVYHVAKFLIKLEREILPPAKWQFQDIEDFFPKKPKKAAESKKKEPQEIKASGSKKKRP
jgi:transcriptional regulator with XRE-family HTH domain